MRIGVRGRALAIAATLVAGAFTTGGARAAVAGDDFTDASAIGSLPFSITLGTTGATLEVGEPQPACGDMTSSVWFRYSPATDGRYEVGTLASDFDTVLGVYEGSSLATLTALACSDNVVPQVNNRSLTWFRGYAGHTYYIQVGGYDGATGDLVLTLNRNAPLPAECPTCPAFRNYEAPEDLKNAHRAGETSIGVNPKTNNAMLLLLGQTVRVAFDPITEAATWTDVSGAFLKTTNDPILFTDQSTGRTFVSQLVANVGAINGYTVDDGATWIPTEPAEVLPSWDHQTIAAGPYPTPLTGTVYPNAVYYCAQPGINASQCARSDDGGLTWGPGLVMNALTCSGLHGHITVGPDGTVYVPNKSCSGAGGDRFQGMLVSTNAGVTWQAKTVPGTTPSLSDPKIAIDRGGKLYFVGTRNGAPVVATRDKGATNWNGDAVDVGADFGIRNTELPMVIAGDADRAAVAFYGSTSGGNDQTDNFVDEWHLYISMTYDGGSTWQTVDATPNDPIQRGCIWLAGGSNPCRNLLDFQDMTVDAQGRVLVSYSDGCTQDCAAMTGRPFLSRDRLAVIARQTSGKRLYAAFDPA